MGMRSEGARGALEAPEEEGVIGMPSTIHAYVASEAPRQGKCNVWKGLRHLEVYEDHRSDTHAHIARVRWNAHFCQAGE
jgi:hypothetical protein